MAQRVEMAGLKTYIESFEGKPVLVYGMGRTGISSVKALKKAGAQVVAGDDSPDFPENLKMPDVGILQPDEDFSRFAFLLLSPGVPYTHPQPHRVVKAAQGAGIEVIGDIELWHRANPGIKTIGITGTNGKSTTTSLTHHILQTCGVKAAFGGNIGNPVFEMKKPGKDGAAVLELSSFQIDLCPSFRPDIAVLLNLSSDHIDRHGSMENYAAVKERLMEGTGTGIVDIDDEYTRAIYERAVERGERRMIAVSTLKTPAGGVYVKDGVLYDAMDGDPFSVGDLKEIRALQGAHNHQNAACSYAAVRLWGVDPGAIYGALQTYPGLQHRQYLVRAINGVAYLNDSKATNAAASAMALSCRQNIYWIVGGRQKDGGLEGLQPFTGRIKHAFLIGESADDFAKWFDTYGVAYTRSFTLDNAVEQAHSMAQDNRGQPGGAGVVLLSPACASFDQYKSFEDRGAHFTRLVEALPEEDGSV